MNERRLMKAEMMNQRRLHTLLLMFTLCFSPWFISAQWPEDTFLDNMVEQCPGDCLLQHYSSNYNSQCSDDCETRGYDYYWCNTKDGWDYCSPRENVDYYGNACRQDHPCDKHGKKYMWCDLEKGGWGGCGYVEVRAKHQTIYMDNCIDDCQYDSSGDYFWCHTKTSWDYCSPKPDITYKTETCRPDHPCGTHGKNYRWCYTSYNNDWDYCGVNSPEVCENTQPFCPTYTIHEKQQSDDDKYICKEHSGIPIVFKTEGNQDFIQECDNNLQEEALGLIEQWDYEGLGNQSRSNLTESKRLRIDQQNVFLRGNLYYYNLQIQINKQPMPGQNITVSQIIVPVGTSAKHMFDAFQYSLLYRKKIVLEVDDQQTIISNNNNNYIKPECCKYRKK